MLVSAVQWSPSALCVRISPPPRVSLPASHLTLLGHHIAPGWVPYATQQLPTSYCFTHGSVYMSVLLSQFVTPFSPSHVHKSVLYVCISIPALQIDSSVPFFWIPDMCVNVYLLLSGLLHSVCIMITSQFLSKPGALSWLRYPAYSTFYLYVCWHVKALQNCPESNFDFPVSTSKNCSQNHFMKILFFHVLLLKKKILVMPNFSFFLILHLSHQPTFTMLFQNIIYTEYNDFLLPSCHHPGPNCLSFSLGWWFVIGFSTPTLF